MQPQDELPPPEGVVEPERDPATVSPAAAEAPTNGRAAAVGTADPVVVGHPNGGVPSAMVPDIWTESERRRIRERWQELQLKFIDDPTTVAGEAERLVHDAVASLSASLDARRAELHGQRAARGGDTEHLRAALRDYREFLDRILGL